MKNYIASFEKLVIIMDELREKCPWDKKQTIHSLRSMTIEETYELADGIDANDWQNIKEELGDLLLHILFYSKIGAEKNEFTLTEVIDGICEKLVRRHPHIYGNIKVKDEYEVKQNWEKIKQQEKQKDSIIDGLPNALPPLQKAIRLQEKAKQIGFEWENKEDVWKKVEEEICELKDALSSNNQPHIEEEFGDVMFSLVNYARFIDVDANLALEKTNNKFVSRFKKMENAAKLDGNKLENMTLEQMDLIWNKIKHQ